ncbi:MAG: hypothetical protein ACR2P4_06690 [Gammaproteobacteria bacterium]
MIKGDSRFRGNDEGAAVCYNAIDGKHKVLTCDKNGKRRFCNVIPA